MKWFYKDKVGILQIPWIIPITVILSAPITAALIFDEGESVTFGIITWLISNAVVLATAHCFLKDER